MQSSTLPLPADIRWRRLVAIAAFLGLLYVFRHLAPVFICFVVIERTLTALASPLEKHAKLKRPLALGAVLALLSVAAAALLLFAVRAAVPFVHVVRDEGRPFVEALLAKPAVAGLTKLTGVSVAGLADQAKHHITAAISYATAAAHLVLFLLMGFVLALIYLFEREELSKFHGEIDARSPLGTLVRFFGYAADAIFITVRMQAVVAVVNAVVTLPILLLLRLPNVPVLFVLILISGLLPVVGNLISGAVLCTVAYTARGPWAVGVFLVATFVLHKIESYYLNPRLAAEHVKLPGLVLVVSLLLFEQVFGFIGLFLSFPALYVASRIANEWRDGIASATNTRSDARDAPVRPTVPNLEVPDAEENQAGIPSLDGPRAGEVAEAPAPPIPEAEAALPEPPAAAEPRPEPPSDASKRE